MWTVGGSWEWSPARRSPTVGYRDVSGHQPLLLECGPADWPDDRVRVQLRRRLGDEGLGPAPILDRDVFVLRASVHEPMRYGRLFLLGDATHPGRVDPPRNKNC